MTGRNCFREPIVEIFQAAVYLDAAVSAHLEGRKKRAEELIRLADIPAITVWTESLWGAAGPLTRRLLVDERFPFIPKEERAKTRMPKGAELQSLLNRDGYRCRFCEIPLIRAEIRSRMRLSYTDALRWGNRNSEQHAAFQAMWLQYDHLVPHARGGGNDFENMIVTCAPCNNGRSNLTCEEVGLTDPREREPLRTTWDGLERFQRL